jgi:hypothetical protein
MPYSTYKEAKAAALAVLGNNAKFPDPPANLDNLRAGLNKAVGEFVAAVGNIQKKIVVMQTSLSGTKNVLTSWQRKVDGDNFGLGDDADDAKLAKAQKIFDDYVDFKSKEIDDMIKGLGDVDKSIDTLSHSMERWK